MKDYTGKMELVKLENYECEVREYSESWGQLI